MSVAMIYSSTAFSRVRARWPFGVVRAALAIAVAGLAGGALAADESKSISRFASRSMPAAPASTPDATRPETIILPWFSPGVMSQPTIMAPADEAGLAPPGSVTPPSSVIQLPAFPGSISRSSASNGASVPGITPAVNAPPRKRPPPHHGIPEIDPASAGNALTLLIGGMLILTDRRRRAWAC